MPVMTRDEAAGKFGVSYDTEAIPLEGYQHLFRNPVLSGINDVRIVERRLGEVQRPALGRGATGRTGAAVAVGEDHLDGSACVGEGEHVPYFRKSGTSRSSSSRASRPACVGRSTKEITCHPSEAAGAAIVCLNPGYTPLRFAGLHRAVFALDGGITADDDWESPVT